MQLIPISEEEQLTIDKNMAANRETSAVAQKMLFSISPLASPKKRDSISVNESNLAKQEVIDKLINALQAGDEQKEKYNALQNKLFKFGY